MATTKQIFTLPIVIAIISVMFFSIQTVTAAGSLDITGVKNFAILANTYTNSGAGTVLNGDLGYLVAPANHPTVFSTTFASPSSIYVSTKAIQANLITSANNPVQSGTCTTARTVATVLGSLPQPLTPGVYCIGGAASIGTAGITLSGDGVYIFRISGTLTTMVNSEVKLVENAKADNVFWVPAGATTLGANSVFAGNILSNAAITVGSTVDMYGRILSNGAVTTGSLVAITSPAVLTTPTQTGVRSSDCIDNCVMPTLGLNSKPAMTNSQLSWDSYNREDLKFEQTKMGQELKATKLWDSSKIQRDLPVKVVPYLDDRDTMKFANTKMSQELKATKLWDSSKIQSELPDRVLISYSNDDKADSKLKQMKVTQELKAKRIWDSSRIQN